MGRTILYLFDNGLDTRTQDERQPLACENSTATAQKRETKAPLCLFWFSLFGNGANLVCGGSDWSVVSRQPDFNLQSNTYGVQSIALSLYIVE